MTFKEALFRYFDAKGLLVDYLLDTVIKNKLQQIVDDTSNPFDNALMTFVYPQLKAAAEAAIQNLIDQVK